MRAFVRRASSTTVIVGTLAFWVGMAVAARSYPSEYDWRYITISSLVYAERNPSGFLWARGGILLCGIAGLYWTARLLRTSKRQYIAERPVGIFALGLGYLCMTFCALLPEGRFRVPRGHDFLALAAFVGLSVATASGTANPRRIRLYRRAGTTDSGDARLRAGEDAQRVIAPSPKSSLRANATGAGTRMELTWNSPRTAMCFGFMRFG